MRYYFARHGIAADLAPSDFARELTKRGRRRIGKAAKVMNALGIAPARIYASPRIRARQTADIIAAELGMAAVTAEEVDFGFDIAAVERLSRGLPAESEVMFVGHNPDMSLAVHEMTGVDVSMKKGGLARVDVIHHQARRGELVWLIAPKVFDALRLEEKQGPLSVPPPKAAATAFELHDLIQGRWSPIGFDPDRGIGKAALMSMLEAARWAASSSNLQPWRFIVAPRENRGEFQKILSVLKEGNVPWARHAAVLMIAAAKKHRRPDVLNRHASHDLGQAIAQMVLQALDHGIHAHQMGGFFPDKARAVYDIPAEYEPFTAIAFGYTTLDLSHLSQAHRQREAAPRPRQALHEMVYNGSWGRAADFLE